MAIQHLDHYFVRAKDLERSRHFYCELLGFEIMPRPDFAFPGYWLGVNGKIQIHMGLHGIAQAPRFYLGSHAQSATDNSGVVDHIAFTADAPEAMAERFQGGGIKPRLRYIAEVALLQLFVRDPDGLMIELNYPGTATLPAWAADVEGYAP